MCRPPGATSASPARTRSRWRASRTSIWHRLFRRWAKAAVNFSGMCWTMTMPGLSAGNWRSTSSSACVPPVDVPSAMTRSVVVSPPPAMAPDGLLVSVAHARRRAAGCGPPVRSAGSARWRAAAGFSEAQPGLGEHTDGSGCQRFQGDRRTGLGEGRADDRRCRSFSHDLAQKVMPSMRHFTSSTSTSGQSRCIFSRANSGSAARR